MNPRKQSTVRRSRSISVAVSFAMSLSTAHAASPTDEGNLRDAGKPAGTVGLPQLLGEMSDPSSLARWQAQEWTSKQASALRVDKRQNPGFHAEVKEIGNYIREEKNENGQSELVLMEDLGPGVVVRIWFGNVEGNTNTTIRVYFDGDKKASVITKCGDFGYGKDFIKPPFAANRARGGNVYLPIPYGKSCKITAENSKDLFYVIQYRSYGPQTRIETFDRSRYEQALELVAATGASLVKPAVDANDLHAVINETLAPKSSAQADLKPGARAVNYLTVKIEAKDMKAALRSTFLKLDFDGMETVRCPVGDFFGSGLGLNPLDDWIRSVKPTGEMSCRWVMPYQKAARLKIECNGSEPVKVTVSVNYQPWQWDGRSMYFHSNWGILEKLGILPRPNFNFIHIEGKGVYVGDTLSITTDSQVWWGEGPEKISIDGEAFPSQIGTGTEDYYGYAFGERELFCAPFHSQPRTPEGPVWQGTTVNTRIRSLDAIPFKKSLHLDLEIWTHDSNGSVQKYVDYAVATYWYGFPDAKGHWISEPVRMKTP
jgi:hypothetical protein